MGTSLDEVKNNLAIRLRPILFPHLTETANNPERVYHYTDAAGLLGILQSKSIWASHFAYLSDRSELVYGQRMIRKVLRELATSRGLNTERLDNYVRTEGNIYIASFCERPDLLSQWRGFSRTQDGYSIAFRFDKLTSPEHAISARVVYQTQEQESRISSVVEQLIETTVEADLLAEGQYELMLFAVNLLWSSYLNMKDPCFAEEQEWRLVASTAFGLKEEFRAANGHIIPFVRLPIRPESVVEIRQGPGLYRDANTEGIARLLASEGFTNAEVTRSLAPL